MIIMKKVIWCAIILTTLLPSLASAETFARDLYFGMRSDPDVVRLQQFLQSQGFFTYPQFTGNYFTVTQEAVKSFQRARGIQPVSGYFGPRSRAAVALIPGPGGGSATGLSPYKGKILISSVSGNSSEPESESITVENITDKDTISITSFRIESSRGGSIAIPYGQNIPGLYGAINNDPVVLRPGDRAMITIGRQEGNVNFRENLCTGYLDQANKFNPSLSRDCPRPDTRALVDLSDRCISIVSSASTCRTVTSSFPDRLLDNQCAAYVDAHLNYPGCVNDYRSDPDFYARRWLVWMQRNEEFFRNSLEHVILKDQQGRVVAEYKY